MPPWGCSDGKGVTVSGGTETRWYHSHINQKYKIKKYLKIAEYLNTSGKFHFVNYKYINFHSIYVLVKSEYIGYEYEYEYMTHKLDE